MTRRCPTPTTPSTTSSSSSVRRADDVHRERRARGRATPRALSGCAALADDLRSIALRPPPFPRRRRDARLPPHGRTGRRAAWFGVDALPRPVRAPRTGVPPAARGRRAGHRARARGRRCLASAGGCHRAPPGVWPASRRPEPGGAAVSTPLRHPPDAGCRTPDEEHRAPSGAGRRSRRARSRVPSEPRADTPPA